MNSYSVIFSKQNLNWIELNNDWTDNYWTELIKHWTKWSWIMTSVELIYSNNWHNFIITAFYNINTVNFLFINAKLLWSSAFENLYYTNKCDLTLEAKIKISVFRLVTKQVFIRIIRRVTLSHTGLDSVAFVAKAILTNTWEPKSISSQFPLILSTSAQAHLSKWLRRRVCLSFFTSQESAEECTARNE